jgi:preprotein translocase subunit SecA
MKLFGSDKIMAIAEMMGLPEDMPIEQKMLTGAIETAQKKVEGRNYSIRKSVLEYDDVMNKQREIIYGQRRKILTSDSIEDSVIKMMESDVSKILNMYLSNDESLEDIDYDALNTAVNSIIGNQDIVDKSKYMNMNEEEITEKIIADSKEVYKSRIEHFKQANMLETYRNVEKYLMLKIVDEKWMDHIDNMAHLKEGIYLRAYGQTNPVDAYRMESFELFEDMSEEIKTDSIKAIFTVEFGTDVNQKIEKSEKQIYTKENMEMYSGSNKPKMVTNSPDTKQPIKVEKAVGRNEPCPCGSGRKYKQCHGKEV